MWVKIKNIVGSHTLRWEWYAPNGKLYYNTDKYETDKYKINKNGGFRGFREYSISWHKIGIKCEDAETLPGEWQVKVFLDNDNRPISTKEFKITARDNTKQRENVYAVIIGISKYKNKEDIHEVKFAENDAKELRCILMNQGGFKNEQIEIKTKEVTKEDIKSELDWLIKNARNENDTALFYFAGHGSRDEDGNVYLLPYETKINKVENYGISRKNLEEKLSEIKKKTKNVIAVLDTCYSGGDRSARDKSKRLVEKVAIPLSSEVTILSSSKDDESSYTDEDKKHGLMTYYLIEGMKGLADKNNDGWVDVYEVFEYLKPQVENQARLKGNKQTPRLVEIDTEVGIDTARGIKLTRKKKQDNK